jgi:hypothetical protein
MKSMWALALGGALLSGSGMAEKSCSALEKNTLKVVQDHFDAGFSLTEADIDRARLNYLQAQLGCREVSKDAYCKEAVPLARRGADIDFNQMNAGTQNLPSVISSQKLLRDLASFCK